MLTRTKNLEFSTSELERFFELDRNTIRKYLQNAGIEPTKSTGNQTLYKLGEAAPVIPKQLMSVSSSDRRNNALARKAEIEASNLLRENIPINEIQGPFDVVLNMLNTLVEGSDLEDDRKEVFFERRDKMLAEIKERFLE